MASKKAALPQGMHWQRPSNTKQACKRIRRKGGCRRAVTSAERLVSVKVKQGEIVRVRLPWCRLYSYCALIHGTKITQSIHTPEAGIAAISFAQGPTCASRGVPEKADSKLSWHSNFHGRSIQFLFIPVSQSLPACEAMRFAKEAVVCCASEPLALTLEP